jgi:hypothetical protein
MPRNFDDLIAALAFAVGFGPLLAASAAFGMIWREQAMGGRFWTVILVFLGSGVVAGALAWIAASATVRGRPPTARFAAMLAWLLVLTPLAVALTQFAAYRLMETDPGLQPDGSYLLGLAGAALSAAFVTPAAGMRLILPAGLVLLFGASALFTWWSGRGSSAGHR